MMVLDITIMSIATGLIGLVVSALWISAVWYRVRRPGESWESARKREMAHLDRLAAQDAERNGKLWARDRMNAELAEIPDTVRSFDDRSIN